MLTTGNSQRLGQRQRWGKTKINQDSEKEKEEFKAYHWSLWALLLKTQGELKHCAIYGNILFPAHVKYI